MNERSKKIVEFAQTLAAAWSKVPDWRFGQLIENLKRGMGTSDLFYVDDDKMLKYIKWCFMLEKEEE